MLNKRVARMATKAFLKKYKKEILDQFKPCPDCKEAYDEHSRKAYKAMEEMFEKMLKGK